MGADDLDALIDEAAAAAEATVFHTFDRSAVRDLDITIQFEEEVLEIDVYINAEDTELADTVAHDAIEAARAVFDERYDPDEF